MPDDEIRPSTSPPPAGTHLQTWQEIAAYLRVSIRAAQNWEKEGLPVRRVPGKKPRVFAVRSELDAWLLQGGAPAQSPGPAKRSFTRRAVVIGAAGTLGLTAGGVWLVRKALRPPPQRAVIQGGQLTALDGMGKPLFQFTFPDMSELPAAEAPWRIQVIDFEGNGRNRVVAAIRRQDGSEELFCLSPHGQLEWSVPCRPPLLDVNGKPFEPAWRFSNIVHAAGARGDRSLWVSIAHINRFPGCVLRLDRRGATRLQFANPGNVQALARLSRPGGDLIFAGGIHNGFNRTFTAVFAADDPPSTAPLNSEGPTRYGFTNPPRGSGRAYVLFPTSELSVAHGAPYGHVEAIRVTQDGITVDVQAPRLLSYLTYSLSLNLEPRVTAPSGGYFIQHEANWKEGRLDHPSSACPETARPMRVRRWTPESGWQDRPSPWRLSTNSL